MPTAFPAPFSNLMEASGRVLLGLYFFLPGGVNKVFNYESTAQYMADSGMVAIPFFLILTIIIQLGCGAGLTLGYKTQLNGFLLAGLTLVINVVIHDFWNMTPEGLEYSHEVQNFVKNLGIMAGLLVVAGLGAGPWSLDNRGKVAN